MCGVFSSPRWTKHKRFRFTAGGTFFFPHGSSPIPGCFPSFVLKKNKEIKMEVKALLKVVIIFREKSHFHKFYVPFYPKHNLALYSPDLCLYRHMFGILQRQGR